MKRRVFVILGVGLLSACRNSSDPVLAKVGSLTITQSEFRAKLADVAQNYQNYVATPNGRRQFLDVLIREKIILAAAQSSEVRKSAEFRSQVERLKAEEEARLREGQDYLLTRLWLDDLRRKGVLTVAEDETRDYYRKHPVEVSVRHILLAAPDEAEEVAKKARGGGNFAALAKADSLDRETAAEGGRMQGAVYGEVIPDLEDAVFRMRTGEIVGPIKSKFGYHVLKKDGEKNLAYAQAKDRISRLLEKQKLDRYLQSVQEKFPVEVVDEQFK